MKKRFVVYCAVTVFDFLCVFAAMHENFLPFDKLIHSLDYYA